MFAGFIEAPGHRESLIAVAPLTGEARPARANFLNSSAALPAESLISPVRCKARKQGCEKGSVLKHT